MANKYYKQHPERSQISDTGMLVATTVTVITMIQILMYGFTWVPLIWLAITLIYIAIASATQFKSQLRETSTVIFLFICVVAIFSEFLFDKAIVNKENEPRKTDKQQIRVIQYRDEGIEVEEQENFVVEDVKPNEQVHENEIDETMPDDMPEVLIDNEEQSTEQMDNRNFQHNQHVNVTPENFNEQNRGETEGQFDDDFQ